jgi:hypothetical protein
MSSLNYEFPKNKDHFVPLNCCQRRISSVSLPFKEKKRLLLSNQPAIPFNPSSQVSQASEFIAVFVLCGHVLTFFLILSKV